MRPIARRWFHYVYAVLHDPQYRETYAQNLKREFPRIPLYGDSEATFWQWAAWGEALMAQHIGYEQVAPFALVRTDVPDEKVRASGQPPMCILKSDKDAGRIVVDSETTLSGVPREAWAYTLATAARSTGCSTSTRRRSRRTRPFEPGSTPTVSRTTRKR